jgi:hypothetical protein
LTWLPSKLDLLFKLSHNLPPWRARCIRDPDARGVWVIADNNRGSTFPASDFDGHGLFSDLSEQQYWELACVEGERVRLMLSTSTTPKGGRSSDA